MKKSLLFVFAFMLLISSIVEASAVIDDNSEAIRAFYLEKADTVQSTDTSVCFTDDSGRGELCIAKNPNTVAILYASLACLWVESGGAVQIGIGGDSAAELYMDQIGYDISENADFRMVSDRTNGTNWDVESILSMRPDLIICSMSMNGWSTIGEVAQSVGIPVIGIQCDSVQDYLKWLKVFCYLNDRNDLWENVSETFLSQIIELVANVPTDVHLSILILRDSRNSSIIAFGSDCQTGQIAHDLGAVNLIESDSEYIISGSVETDVEEILSLNPDIILVPQAHTDGATIATFEHIMKSNPVWTELSAVKNGRVYFLEKRLFHNKPNYLFTESYRVLRDLLYK